MDQRTLDLLALTLVPGLGTSRIHALLKEFETPEGILRLGRRELSRAGLSPESAVFVAGGAAKREAEQAASQLRRLKAEVIALNHSEFPYLLKQIFEPPLILYLAGLRPLLYRPSIALVGSRRASVYGREVTEKLAGELASSGINIVSGLARGIDSAAHRGALNAGGTTVAVLGSGIDVVYPKENKKLYQRIRENGCLVSEFPLGTFPAPQNFPIRNRIISGLCLGTVICEAREFSGSLITARLTLEQNRELWAVPGNITSAGSYGPNYLIKQGASPVLSFQDVLDQLPVYVLESMLEMKPEKISESGESERGAGLTDDERSILRILQPDRALTLDRLLERARMDLSRLTSALFGLEMKDMIRALPGRQYCRRQARGGGK